MTNDMGSFRVDVELENPARPGQRRMTGARRGGSLGLIDQYRMFPVAVNAQWRPVNPLPQR